MQPRRKIILAATHAPAAAVTGAARFGMILLRAAGTADAVSDPSPKGGA